MDLAGKVCVVTGGARGLGRALAERFAVEGAAGVVIADLDGDGAVAAAAALAGPGLGLEADVGRADEVHGVVARTVERFGRVDLFCSNAALTQLAGGIEDPDEAWYRAWAVNVMAHLHAARAVLPSMLAQGSGYLLPVSSGAGMLAYVHSAPYTVTKHAVVSLAEMLAITYGDKGIRVSCVCPGGIRTDSWEAGTASGSQMTMAGAISPAEAAERIVAGVHDERFLIVTHPELSEWEQFKVADRDRWIRGMRKVQARSAPPARHGPARVLEALDAASAALAEVDPVLAELVRIHGSCRLRAPNPDGPFGTLVRAIVFQQLAGRAAATIHGRFRALVDGPLTPEAVLALSEEALRGAGLSRNKALSIRDLAQHVADGSVHFDRLGSMGDEDLIAMLTAVRGIGRWTAEMFLIFQLRRLDVWPVDDLGVRAGYARAYGLAEIPKPKALVELGERFRPYRSVAAWYCYRVMDVRTPEA